MARPSQPLLPLVVVCANLTGTIRPVMDFLLRMSEATTEWCPRTHRRVLCYLARHAKVLAGMTVDSETWNHETLFYPPIEGERTTRRIAGFPGPGEHVGNYLDGMALWQRMLQANWGFFCDRTPRRPEHIFYVEPVPQWLPKSLDEARLPHKTLVIARDPRSELGEHWLSGGRRGALPTVLNCIDTPLSLTERQANRFVRARLADLAKIQPTTDTVCVRYEDIVGDTARTWDRLRSWLGLTATPAPPPPATGHEWPEARWRPLLPDPVLAHYRMKMQRELEALGYAG